MLIKRKDKILGSQLLVFGSKFDRQRGLSIIEIILAISLFAIIAATSITLILGSFSSSRLGKEESKAAGFAVEGLEATASIRNQGWSVLTAADCASGCGLSKSETIWSFFGGSDDPDGSGKFTRTITIENVERDGGGDIADSGTEDEDTKKITSGVAWDFTPTRSNMITLTTFLTNWQKARATGGASAGTIDSCGTYCQTIGYSSGTCRATSAQCTTNDEIHKGQGDQYCTGGPSEDTCCCAE